MEESDHYKGREHSGVKHYLLESYLEKLFMIIGQHERRICYIDCFSGPWMESDENLSGTSIAISLRVMLSCRDSLREMGKSVEFRALFIEKEKRAYKKLDTYLKGTHLDGITTTSMNGEFHDLRGDILRWCGTKDFGFFFIDPKGWKNDIDIPTLTPLLQRQRSEYLINFMYGFLVRAHTQKLFQNDMQAIFGELPDTSDMSPKKKEEYLIQQYRNALSSISTDDTERLRTAHVSILDPIKERTKYHLVYLTRHPLGIVKFMDTSKKWTLYRNVCEPERNNSDGSSRQDRRSCLLMKLILALRTLWISKLLNSTGWTSFPIHPNRLITKTLLICWKRPTGSRLTCNKHSRNL